MAEIATAATLDVAQDPWQRISGDNNIYPFGEIVMTDAFTIALLVNTNTGITTMTGTLPPGWAYRLAELRIETLTTTENQAEQPEEAMLVRFIQDGTTVKSFGLYNQTQSGQSNSAISAFLGLPAATTSAALNFYSPHWMDLLNGLMSDFWNTEGGLSTTIVVTWVDSQASQTAAIDVVVYIRFLRYSIEQARRALVHTPQLIIG